MSKRILDSLTPELPPDHPPRHNKHRAVEQTNIQSNMNNREHESASVDEGYSLQGLQHVTIHFDGSPGNGTSKVTSSIGVFVHDYHCTYSKGAKIYAPLN